MDTAEQWRVALVQSLTELGKTVAGFIPNLFGMLVILVLGYIVSRALERLTRVLLNKVGFDRVSERVGVKSVLESSSLQVSASHIVGKLVFWLFMLTFLISAAEALGLENVSRTIDSFVGYVPNVIAAAVIVVIGLVLAHFVKDLVRSGATGLGVDYADALGRLAFAVLLIVISSLAIGQLKVDTGLINRIIEIGLVAAGAALALAFGLGSREAARNIIAGVYARDVYRPGIQLAWEGRSGRLEEIGIINSRVRSDDDKRRATTVYVPNSHLAELVVETTGEVDEP